jgi:hypothetical protein
VKIRVLEKINAMGNPAILGLAVLAGLGFILMMIALGMGVIGGADADSSAVGLLFAVGLALFILGAVGWFATARPDRHFDDINVPQYTGHHEGDHHDDAHAAH